MLWSVISVIVIALVIAIPLMVWIILSILKTGLEAKHATAIAAILAILIAIILLSIRLTLLPNLDKIRLLFLVNLIVCSIIMIYELKKGITRTTPATYFAIAFSLTGILCILYILHTYPPMPKEAVVIKEVRIKFPTQLPKNEIRSIILEYLKQYYNQRNGTLQITTDNDRRIDCFVSKLRNEVLKEKMLWEKIQIGIGYYYEDDSMLIITGLMDGWFASGIRPPSEEGGYYDMEKQYSSQLRNYTDEWFVKLQEYIKEKEENKDFTICISVYGDNHSIKLLKDLSVNGIPINYNPIRMLVIDNINDIYQMCYEIALKPEINTILIKYYSRFNARYGYKEFTVNPSRWEEQRNNPSMAWMIDDHNNEGIYLQMWRNKK